MLPGALGETSGAVDSYVVGLVGEALGDGARLVPRPRLGTVLVLDEHFSADFERRKGSGRFVRLLPLGEKAVPVGAFLEFPRLPPGGTDSFVGELVRACHELEGVSEPSAVNHHSRGDLCLGVDGVTMGHYGE